MHSRVHLNCTLRRPAAPRTGGDSMPWRPSLSMQVIKAHDRNAGGHWFTATPLPQASRMLPAAAVPLPSFWLLRRPRGLGGRGWGGWGRGGFGHGGRGFGGRSRRRFWGRDSVPVGQLVVCLGAIHMCHCIQHVARAPCPGCPSVSDCRRRPVQRQQMWPGSSWHRGRRRCQWRWRLPASSGMASPGGGQATAQARPLAAVRRMLLGARFSIAAYSVGAAKGKTTLRAGAPKAWSWEDGTPVPPGRYAPSRSLQKEAGRSQDGGRTDRRARLPASLAAAGPATTTSVPRPADCSLAPRLRRVLLPQPVQPFVADAVVGHRPHLQAGRAGDADEDVEGGDVQLAAGAGEGVCGGEGG